MVYTVKPPLSGLPKYGHLPQPGGKVRRFYIVRMRKTGAFLLLRIGQVGGSCGGMADDSSSRAGDTSADGCDAATGGSSGSIAGSVATSPRLLSDGDVGDVMEFEILFNSWAILQVIKTGKLQRTGLKKTQKTLGIS